MWTNSGGDSLYELRLLNIFWCQNWGSDFTWGTRGGRGRGAPWAGSRWWGCMRAPRATRPSPGSSTAPPRRRRRTGRRRRSRSWWSRWGESSTDTTSWTPSSPTSTPPRRTHWLWFQDMFNHKLFRCVTGNILEGLQIFLASGIYFVSHGVQINLWCSLLTVSHHFLSRTVEMLLCPAGSQQPGQHYVNDKSI